MASEQEVEIVIIMLLDEGFAWTGERIAAVRIEQLAAATSCARWDLRALLNHTLGTMDQIAAAANGTGDPSRLDAQTLADTDWIGADPTAAFEAIAARALAVWHTPGVLERTCALPWGPTPAPVVAQLSAIDAVVHGWDISRAIGEAVDIPLELAEPLLGISKGFVHEGLRGTAFAEEVRIVSGSASDRLVAFLGRTP
ncbi:MAG: TIGR03086 family metal-binding protein [Pseudonocardiaceae bacterium]